MRAIHTRRVRLPEALVTFDYYDAPLPGDVTLIVAAISVVGSDGSVHGYTRQWPLARWSVPTRQNFEEKFLAVPDYRARFAVKESLQNVHSR